jgi:predicted metalloprotease
MSKFLLTVCAFGLLLSSAFAEEKSPEQHREFAKVLGSTELQWKQVFAKDGRTYRPPVLVLYRGATQASCGGKAYSAMGPFYCPADQKVYLDTSFFDQIATRFRGCDVGNRACQFSQAYVIARLENRHSSNRTTWRPRYAPRLRSATTGSSVRRRATSFPTRSRTGAPSSASAGSTPACNRARSAAATPSPRRSCEFFDAL